MIDCCCDPVVGNPSSSGGDATAINIGGGEEIYVTATASPFEFRTLTGSGMVTLLSSADEIDINVPPITNLGPAGSEIYNGTPNELRGIVAGTNVTINQLSDRLVINATGSTATAANIGAGNVDIYQAASSSPFNFRRLAHMDDLSNLHGRGNLAAFLDTATQNVRIGLPRGFASSNAQVSTNNTLVSLIDVTFAPDTYGVSGLNGEDWLVYWYLKTCQDPSFPSVFGRHTLQWNNAGVWTTADQHQTTWGPTPPSAPAFGVALIQNTEWVFNGGFRLRITVQSTNFSVFNTFEQPRLSIQRFNSV